MKCDGVKEQVYDWAKGTLSGKDLLPLEEHFRDCLNCQAYAKQVKHAISLLDAVKPTPLSGDFKEKVLSKARDLPLLSKPLWQRIKERIQVPYIKWPLESLAATAVILIALVVYKDVSSTKPSKIEMTPRSFQLELPESTVRHPIILPIKDLNQGLSELKGLIKKYDGRILQTLPQEQEVQVSFSLKKIKEEAFLTQLKTIGPLQMKDEGFRDDAGNMVVILKLR
jgi:hypothetical protein